MEDFFSVVQLIISTQQKLLHFILHKILKICCPYKWQWQSGTVSTPPVPCTYSYNFISICLLFCPTLPITFLIIIFFIDSIIWWCSCIISWMLIPKWCWNNLFHHRIHFKVNSSETIITVIIIILLNLCTT